MFIVILREILVVFIYERKDIFVKKFEDLKGTTDKPTD